MVKVTSRWSSMVLKHMLTSKPITPIPDHTWCKIFSSKKRCDQPWWPTLKRLKLLEIILQASRYIINYNSLSLSIFISGTWNHTRIEGESSSFFVDFVKNSHHTIHGQNPLTVTNHVVMVNSPSSVQVFQSSQKPEGSWWMIHLAHQLRLVIFSHYFTPWKFNSSPLKNDGWKTTFLLGWYIFRGYVKLPEGTCFFVHPIWIAGISSINTSWFDKAPVLNYRYDFKPSCCLGWWLNQPIWKIRLVKLDNFPNFRGENYKNIWNLPPPSCLMGWGSEPIPIFEAKNSGTQKRCQWLELRKTPRQSLGLGFGGIFSGENS